MVSAVSPQTPTSQNLILFQQSSTTTTADLGPGGVSLSLTGTSTTGLLYDQSTLNSNTLILLLQVQQYSVSTDSIASSQQSDYQPNSFRQDLKDLIFAIQQGDLQGAQNAYAKLTALQSQSQQEDHNQYQTENSTKTSGNAFQQALTQIGKDLTSNNITAAQSDLPALKAARGHHHHHEDQNENLNLGSGVASTDLIAIEYFTSSSVSSTASTSLSA